MTSFLSPYRRVVAAVRASITTPIKTATIESDNHANTWCFDPNFVWTILQGKREMFWDIIIRSSWNVFVLERDSLFGIILLLDVNNYSK